MGGPAASLEHTWALPLYFPYTEDLGDSEGGLHWPLSDTVALCLVSEPESFSTQNYWLDTGKSQRQRSGPVTATSQLIPQAGSVPGTTTMVLPGVLSLFPRKQLTRSFRERLLHFVCLPCIQASYKIFLKILIIGVE